MFATQLQPSATPCPSSDALLCDRIARIAEQGPEAVDRRLTELKAEWTIGRWVKATCGVLLLLGFGLAAVVNPWWLALTAVAGVALVHYLFFRHSWLGGVFAWFGVRGGAVIEDERIALRVLRGDFKCLPTLGQIQDRDAISRLMDDGGPARDDDDDKLPAKEAAQLITAGSAAERPV